MEIIAPLLFFGAVIGIAVAIQSSQRKEPCTCPECRPDLHPEVVAQLDQKAAYLRAQKRNIEAQAEFELAQAQLSDQRNFFKNNTLGK
jgi:hypothetical protein